MAAYSSESSSPPMIYSTANLQLPDDAPPVVHQSLAPMAVVVGRPPPFSFSGGGKSNPTGTMANRAASSIEESGEHVGGVFMMQGGGNGERSTNTRDNQFSEYDASGGKSFIVDSGASVHATGDPTLFSYLEDTTTTQRLCMANGSMVDITGRGTVRHHNITLHGVLFAPGLAVNIVSVSKLGELDYTVEFTRTSCFIRDAGTGDLVGKGRLVNGLFKLDFLDTPRT